MAGEGTTSASDDHLNEINELAISIDGRFEGLSLPSDCCIFTVPKRLRQTNEKAYTPRVVAIGPYHRLNPSLKPMEDHKLLYLKNFLQHDQNNSLEDYIDKVKSWEDEARNCYDRQIKLNSDKFAEMILLDDIFVIQLLLMHGEWREMLPNDQIFGKPWMLTDISEDMALLENQIPFFIIHRLFEMAFGTHQQLMSQLLELVCLFFDLVTREEKLPEGVMESEVKHFVHAISLSFWPLERKQRPPNENHKKKMLPPSATELVASGVTLKRCDASLLIDERIIENWLSNKEAAMRVINNFGEGNIILPSYNFNSLGQELTNHCRKRQNKWKATFNRDYCSSPWVAISVIAAVLLLLLTIVQTVCSLISLKNHPS